MLWLTLASMCKFKYSVNLFLIKLLFINTLLLSTVRFLKLEVMGLSSHGNLVAFFQSIFIFICRAFA